VRDRLRSMGDREAPLSFYIPAEHYIHYGSSDLVNRISLAPVVQIGVLLLFLLVGYIGYRNIKRSEQRSIWVGMAKETAHQLGTPLSSLSGWLELMRNEIDGESVGQREERLARIGQMVGEMEEDMRHLNQIASRFSQIGSIPELVLTDVGGVLEETIEYFRHRGPQFGRHDISIERQDGARSILLNAELLSWAFENLFKNAIDAMDGQTGAIQIHLVEMPEDGSVQITFRDDGRGIEPENIKRVFEPGFSTKKRGWGLGLAFVRRIIEEYHGGRISVVQSVSGEGTTFEIVLPFGE
jgi:NtrC-family two-component system sensor histidine kinase KinB